MADPELRNKGITNSNMFRPAPTASLMSVMMIKAKRKDFSH